MSDQGDITEELRSGHRIGMHQRLCRSADEIDRLRAELSRISDAYSAADKSAADEIASLRADRDKWHRVAMEAGAITCVGGGHFFPLKDEVKRLREQLVKARDALEEYGQHTVHCDYDRPADPRCTCGFSEAISSLTDE